MNRFVKTGSRTGIVLSLTAAALIAPEVVLAGPGCMNNQRTAQGYYPYSPMGPQMAYGHRAPNSYYPAPPQYTGTMPAPYNRPMTAQYSTPAVVSNTTQPTPAAASGASMPAGETVTVR